MRDVLVDDYGYSCTEIRRVPLPGMERAAALVSHRGYERLKRELPLGAVKLRWVECLVVDRWVANVDGRPSGN